MADQWYYAHEGERQGPVTLEKLKELASSGQLQASDLVWKESMDQWTPASEVQEVATELAPGAPPPTPVRAAPPPTPAPAAPPPMSARRPRNMAARSATAGIDQWLLWKILTLSGAGLLILAFCVPWWGASFDADKFSDLARESGAEPENRDKLKKLQDKIEKATNKYKSWYDKHLDSRLGSRSGEDSEWLWGVETGTGITGFIFSLLILPLAIVPMCVKPVRPWAWIGSFVSAVFGLIAFILALVWIFSCPGPNAPPVLYQGIIIGPYLFLLGSLALLGGAVTDTVFGVIGFIKKLKSK